MNQQTDLWARVKGPNLVNWLCGLIILACSVGLFVIGTSTGANERRSAREEFHESVVLFLKKEQIFAIPTRSRFGIEKIDSGVSTDNWADRNQSVVQHRANKKETSVARNVQVKEGRKTAAGIVLLMLARGR